mmetsp:Transcript_17935/g.41489  ORF Transcript_17935/g.41489 Transcript_17935/m.41489 type:complete len:107 (+) Transcript_17935:39-359(+)
MARNAATVPSPTLPRRRAACDLHETHSEKGFMCGKSPSLGSVQVHVLVSSAHCLLTRAGDLVCCGSRCIWSRVHHKQQTKGKEPQNWASATSSKSGYDAIFHQSQQ